MKIVSCLLAMVFMLSACGFQPLYGQKQQESFGHKLTEVEIEVTSVDANDDRTGLSGNQQRLKQQCEIYLEDSLNPGRMKPPAARYKLLVKLTVSQNPTIQRDASVSRYNISITAAYTMEDKQNGKIITSDSITRDGGYDAAESDYSTYVSSQDVTGRILQTIAQGMKFRITKALDEAAG